MLKNNPAFSGFAVTDTDRAKHFYTQVLGLEVTEESGMLTLRLGGGASVLVYPKPGHVPATFTVLNFPIGDIEATVDGLAARGVEFIRYDGMEHDERGIMRGGGPLIAWFTDPDGNVLSVLEVD